MNQSREGRGKAVWALFIPKGEGRSLSGGKVGMVVGSFNFRGGGKRGIQYLGKYH